MSRTTINLSDDLLRAAQDFADAHGETLDRLVEDALRRVIAVRPPKPEQSKFKLPISKQQGGLQPGVELDSWASVLETMEQGLPLDSRR